MMGVRSRRSPPLNPIRSDGWEGVTSSAGGIIEVVLDVYVEEEEEDGDDGCVMGELCGVCVSTQSIRTRLSPIGFGRNGERVANTPTRRWRNLGG